MIDIVGLAVSVHVLHHRELDDEMLRAVMARAINKERLVAVALEAAEKARGNGRAK